MAYNTESRSKILAFLKSRSDTSFTAEEIFLAVECYGIGRSTVFRQLARLSEEVKIKRLRDEYTRCVRYQYLASIECNEHLHLKCKSCGKLIHLDHELSKLFGEKIYTSEHFSLDASTFLMGICEKCMGGNQ